MVSRELVFEQGFVNGRPFLNGDMAGFIGSDNFFTTPPADIHYEMKLAFYNNVKRATVSGLFTCFDPIFSIV